MLRRALTRKPRLRPAVFPLCLAACVTVTGALALAPAGVAARQDALPSLSISDVSVTEGNSGSTPAVFTLTLSAASTQTVTVRYSARDGSARASGSPRDYNGFFGQATFAPGETSKTVTISVQGDSLVESDESFAVILSSPVNATIADAAGVGTIVNDDVARTLSIDDVRVTEGDTGSLPATFTVTLSGPSTATVTARFATHDGSARASGSPRDYNGFSGQVTFAPGETSKTFTISVQGDTVVEPEETFTVVLSQPTNATIDKSVGSGVIVDNDVARTVSIGDVRVQEGDTGTARAAFPVTLSAASTTTVTVRFSTKDGAARASGSPRDYSGFSGQVTFAPGETARTINVYVQGDTLVEADESFFVLLGQTTGATVADGLATGVIVNDDVARTIAIGDVRVQEGDTGSTPAVFRVTLSAATTATVTVRFSTQDGTARASGQRDYNGFSGQVTFAPGETEKTVNIYVQGDTVAEPDETFTVVLGAASGATVVDGSGAGVIVNDDAAVTTVSVTVEALLNAKTGSLGLRFVASVPADLLIRLVRGKTTVASWRRDIVAGKSTLSLSARTAKAGDQLQIAAKGRDGATGSAVATVAAGP